MKVTSFYSEMISARVLNVDIESMIYEIRESITAVMLSLINFK